MPPWQAPGGHGGDTAPSKTESCSRGTEVLPGQQLLSMGRRKSHSDCCHGEGHGGGWVGGAGEGERGLTLEMCHRGTAHRKDDVAGVG